MIHSIQSNFNIHRVINKFVDKCCYLKTMMVKQSYINTGFIFCNMHIQLYTILTSGSAIKEV